MFSKAKLRDIKSAQQMTNLSQNKIGNKDKILYAKNISKYSF